MMTWMEWYNNLAKPSWTPAPSTISLIWMILYPMIVASVGFMFLQAFRGKVTWKVALPFALNLIANFLFMPMFSGLRSVPLAAVDILIVWTTILWCVTVVWPVYKWVAVAQVPYFVWVSIASVLQLSITVTNWGT
jgi:benzodiazapine receptor